MPPADALPPSPPGRTGWPWQPYDNERIELPRGARWPRVTVVTPSYNQGEFLEATLRSTLLQHYPDLELLVLDGASKDNSVEVIRRYESHLGFWRSEPDGGQAAAISDGFAMATGEILCWLNSDDIFLPGALRTIGRIFATRPRVDFVYGNRLVIDREGAVTGRHVWPWRITAADWALGQPLAQEACFWRRELYDRVGGLDRSKFFIMDYDLFFRMWRVGRFRRTPRYLGCLRLHDEAKNAKHVDVWQRELAEAKQRYDLRAPGYVGARLLNRGARLRNALENRLARRSRETARQWPLEWKTAW